MRTLAALLAWLITTAALAVAVPAAWVQLNLVDDNGFTALSQQVAQRPALQTAVAGELATQAVGLIRERGLAVDYAQVRDVAAAYTAGPAFPPRFARVMQGVHRGMFTDDGSGEWVVDLAAMLNDSAFQPTMSDYDVAEPSTLTAPLTVAVPESLRAAQLRKLADGWRWLSIGAVALTGVCAVLTLVAARRRGRAVAGLGIAALAAGGAGWAGAEVVRGYLTGALDTGLNNSQAAVRRIADAMVATGIDGVHHWLTVTLAAGAVLVVLGAAVTLLGGLRKR